MVAEYDGKCADCGDKIVAGVDEIVYSEEAGGWVHEDCS